MKAVMWIVLVLVLLIAGVGAYVVLNSGGLIKDAIEASGPDFLGADVSVAEVDISLVEGSGAIRGLDIARNNIMWNDIAVFILQRFFDCAPCLSGKKFDTTFWCIFGKAKFNQ